MVCCKVYFVAIFKVAVRKGLKFTLEPFNFRDNFIAPDGLDIGK